MKRGISRKLLSEKGSGVQEFNVFFKLLLVTVSVPQRCTFILHEAQHRTEQNTIPLEEILLLYNVSVEV